MPDAVSPPPDLPAARDRAPTDPLDDLLGQPVFITWRRPQDDWNHFTLLDIREDRIRIQGRNHPEGFRHDGDRFWATFNSMVSIREGD